MNVTFVNIVSLWLSKIFETLNSFVQRPNFSFKSHAIYLSVNLLFYIILKEESIIKNLIYNVPSAKQYSKLIMFLT